MAQQVTVVVKRGILTECEELVSHMACLTLVVLVWLFITL
jgi:hypothetical protein